MRRLFFLIVGAYGAFGCSSCCGSKVAPVPCNGNDPSGNPFDGLCKTSADCKDHYACEPHATGSKTSEQCCELVPRICKADTDCCPGQTCAPSSQTCFDVCTQCTTDKDCGGNGDLFCKSFNDGFCGGTRCMFALCSSYPNNQCPAGQTCFDSVCVISPPCNGSCPPGSACVTQINQCQSYGSLCQVTCQPGFLAVYTDPSNVWDSCNRSALACTCAELPPLTSNDLGRHSTVATSGSNAFVSMYDGQYGDLVIATVNSNGSVAKMEWVDGVPATGTIVAGPSGPRGGISDPGPDVGRYTSIGLGGGALRVSYYDVTNGALKYIEQDSTGKWTNIHTVDSVAGGGDVGLYTSLAFDTSGNPSIAYFQRAGGTGTTCASAPAGTPAKYLTALKLATATKAHPTAKTDWTIQTVDCAARPIPPCDLCTASQSCVSIGGSVTCATPASTCNPGCTSGQACVTSGGAAVCAATQNTTSLAGVPPGVGVFASLAINGTTPAIAYYDSVNEYLRTAVKSGSTWKLLTVDGLSSTGTATASVGQFPALMVSGSNYLLAYQDFTHRYLRWLSAPTATGFVPVPDADQLNPTPAEIIDTGVTPASGDGATWVGANVHLVQVPSKGTFAVYQNATAVSLKLSGQNGTTGAWSLLKEFTEGGVGFYADGTNVGGTIVMSHAKILTKLVKGQAVLDNSLVIDTYIP